MAGVTDQGWEPKLFSEIRETMSDSAKGFYGEAFPTTPESPFGGLSNIVSAPIKDIWDLGQAILDTQTRSTATGIYLDYLAELVGLTRLESSGSVGNLLVTGKAGTTIQSNTAVKDELSRVVLIEDSTGINRSTSYQSTFEVKTVLDNVDYTIVIGGLSVTFNSSVGNDAEFILLGLKANIEANTLYLTEVVDNQLTITYPNYNNLLATTNSDTLVLYSVGVLVSGEAALEGDLIFESDTITTLVTPNLGIYSVTNPLEFTVGRDRETDEELRVRMSEREQSTGTATKPSIEAALSEVTGVSNALLRVNDTLEDDPITGIPAKQFEAIVTGGDENSIAEVLHRTKPVMGVMHGDILKTITDSNGDTQPVRFSRPTTPYAWVRITYTINSEEEFPTGGEATMKSLVVAKGNNMYQGEDLEATKFYGEIYKVQGVYVNNIEVALTDELTDTPNFVTTPIPLDETQSVSFQESTVVVTTA